MRDALFYPLFQQKELERERVVVLGEFDRNEANPRFHLGREIDRKLWYQHFSRKNVIGDREAILATTREKMQTLKDRYYVPNNSALLFAGDVDAGRGLRARRGAVRRVEGHRGSAQALSRPRASAAETELDDRGDPAGEHGHGAGRRGTARRWWRTSRRPSRRTCFRSSSCSPPRASTRTSSTAACSTTSTLTYFSQVHTGPINAIGADLAGARRQSPRRAAERDPSLHRRRLLHRRRAGVCEGPTRGVGDLRPRASHELHSHGVVLVDHRRTRLLPQLSSTTCAKSRARTSRHYVRRYIAGKPSVTGVLVSDENRGKIALLKNAEVVRPVKGSSATAMTADESRDGRRKSSTSTVCT